MLPYKVIVTNKQLSGSGVSGEAEFEFLSLADAKAYATSLTTAYSQVNVYIWDGTTVIPYESSAPAFDADYQAVLDRSTALGYTAPSAAQQTLQNTLVTDLKTAGVWTKMKAIYPIVGGTASSHKFNLKDPRDLDAAFRLTFTSGFTHSADGMVGNGTSATANTYLNPANDLASVDSNSLSVYLNTGTSAAQHIEIGQNNNQWLSAIRWSGDQTYIYNPTNQVVIREPNTEARGLTINTRRAINDFVFYRAGTLIGSNTSNRIASFPSASVHLGSAGGSSYYSNRRIAFASIGDGLTDSDISTFTTAINAFQTTLGRQV